MYIEERILALEKENLNLKEEIVKLRNDIQKIIDFNNHLEENSDKNSSNIKINNTVHNNNDDSIKEINLNPKKLDIIELNEDLIIKKLKKTRSILAKNEKLPAYCIVSNKAIEEMAKYLPSTDTEFLNISGIGNTKLDKYSRFFLEDINNIKNGNFIENNQAKHIETRMKTTPIKTKPYHLTYETYKEVGNLDNIAKIRKMTKYSVVRDLITCSNDGFDDILFSNFIDKSKLNLFMESYLLLENTSFDNLREILPKSFENYEIMICKQIIE